MKKINILSLSILSLFLFNCSDDDSTDNTSNCFSPSQNLETAYDTDAIGCDCDSENDEDICITDENEKKVALVCFENQWVAVEGGPCFEIPEITNYSGEWIGTQFLVEQPYDLNGDGTPSADYKIELPCLIREITLNEDGTGLFKSNTYGGPEGAVTCIEYLESSVTWMVNEDETMIILSAGDSSIEIVILDEVTIELLSNSLLDDEIGIPGKIIYEKEQ